MVKSLIVDKYQGEKIRSLLKKYGLIDPKLKIKIIDNKIYFPILEGADLSVIKEFTSDFNLEDTDFEIKRNEMPLKLRNLLSSSIPDADINLLPRSYDVIGDLILINLNDEIWDKRNLIGKIIKEKFKNIRSVFAKKGPVRGEYRIRNIENIAGDNDSITLHKENGCLFNLDLSKVYFNSRLGGERLRVANKISKNEIVTDMFAGVGPFSILIAKKRGAFVNAIDSNPFAIAYLERNSVKNKVEKLVKIFKGNSDEIIKKYLLGTSDRVIMNLPEKAFNFLDAAIAALKSRGGVIHYYTFSDEENLNSKIKLVKKKIEAHGFKIRDLKIMCVREIAPFYYQYVLDINLN
jgi:tRNA (guanine37-N1)-methyltransferase